MADEQPKKRHRPEIHINFKGELHRQILRIKKATNEGSARKVVATALMRYEADLIDEGKITLESALTNDE